MYPEEITDELIGDTKGRKSDPLSGHSNSAYRIELKLMGRKRITDLIRVINKLRKEIPGIVLRTTLITGFPTETEEDHQELMDFVRDMKFERLGVFTYSKEEDTPAAKLKPQILAKVKKQRQKDLMKLQQANVFENSEKQIGKIFDVLVEGRGPMRKRFI